MSYTSLQGMLKPGTTARAPSAPLTAEQSARQQASQAMFTQTWPICQGLSKAGMLPIQPPHPNAGMPAVLGTPEMTDCLAKASVEIAAGKSPSQASDAILRGTMGGTGTNWLLYGGIAAVALVGGAMFLTRKK